MPGRARLPPISPITPPAVPAPRPPIVCSHGTSGHGCRSVPITPMGGTAHEECRCHPACLPATAGAIAIAAVVGQRSSSLPAQGRLLLTEFGGATEVTP